MSPTLPSPDQIPNWIASVRRRLGLTQTEFAERIECGQTSVCMWEAGEREPGYGFICKIAALASGGHTYQPTAAVREPAASDARWERAIREAYAGDAASPQSNAPTLTDALGKIGLTTGEADAVLGAFADERPYPDVADTLDAARDDLGDAIGLLIALNGFLASDGTDRGRSVAAIGRCALEKVRRFYGAVADVGEARP